MPRQPGVAVRRAVPAAVEGPRCVAVSGRIPYLESSGNAVPLTDVVQADAVIECKLAVRFEGILPVDRPLMELEVVYWNSARLGIVRGIAEQVVQNDVAGAVRSPTQAVSSIVSIAA